MNDGSWSAALRNLASFAALREINSSLRTFADFAPLRETSFVWLRLRRAESFAPLRFKKSFNQQGNLAVAFAYTDLDRCVVGRMAVRLLSFSRRSQTDRINFL
jgi:hypothetical protein